MMPAKPPPAPKKAPGRNVEEWERGTVRVRVPREHAEALAKRWSCDASEAVVRAVREATER